MKTAILGLLISVLGAYSAYAQGSGSHGGDGLVIEFTGTARNIRAAMVPFGALAGCPTEAQFKEVIDQTKVISEPTVLIDFVERDAKNDADAKLITLSRARLVNLSDPLAYVNLVMHEYFGILKLEGTNETSASQFCLNQIRSRGVDVVSTIYKINPITTFEQQFTQGKSGLQCNWQGDRLRIKLTFVDNKSAAVESAILTTDDQYTMFRWQPDGYGSSSYWLGQFKKEYAISEGIIHFRFIDSDRCTRYVFDSLDHMNWKVTLTNYGSKCGFGQDKMDPFKERGASYVMSCQPVYFLE